MEITNNIYQAENDFILIDDYLVPGKFIEKVYEEVKKIPVNTTTVTSIEDYFSPDFLHKVTLEEEAVLGKCLLKLLGECVLNLD